MSRQVEEVERVDEFNYSGSMIDEGGGSDTEVPNGIQDRWGVRNGGTRAVCDRRIPEKLKAHICTAMVRQRSSVVPTDYSYIVYSISI